MTKHKHDWIWVGNNHQCSTCGLVIDNDMAGHRVMGSMDTKTHSHVWEYDSARYAYFCGACGRSIGQEDMTELIQKWLDNLPRLVSMGRPEACPPT